MSVVPLLLSGLLGCSLFGSKDKDPEAGKDPTDVRSPFDEDDDDDDEANGRKRRRRTEDRIEDIELPEIKGRFKPVQDPCAGFDEPGLYNLPTEFDGETIKSLLYVPPGPGPHDLVVLLHGGTSSPERILKQTRFIDQAQADGFAILAPTSGEMDNHGRHWNTGKFDGLVKRARNDVAFLDHVAKRARNELCVNRVLVAGFSSGGQMAHRWGCQGSEVDAILSAAGELLVPSAGCKPHAVLGFVGKLDKVFSGPSLEGSDQPSSVETIEMWAKINGCDLSQTPTEKFENDTRCKSWRGCKHATELCVVEDFPHGWPAPWHRHPTRCNATVEGSAWFKNLKK